MKRLYLGLLALLMMAVPAAAARIHVLESYGNNLYRCVVHATISAGTNAAGVTWASAIQNSGKATSRLTVGTGAGQITTQEMNSITAGTVIEVEFTFQDDPTLTSTARNALLDQNATAAVAEAQANLQIQLRYFGLTRN